ncbi:hypothetical protein BJ912DRAFT_1056549 [Pholiota molesta]|nr:hypothetical protein BJ912DRAFT_1056549 [Pholiota molesta]
MDAAILSAHATAPYGTPPDAEAPVHVTFVDWVPGICSLLGYLVISLIDKDRSKPIGGDSSNERGFGGVVVLDVVGSGYTLANLSCACGSRGWKEQTSLKLTGLVWPRNPLDLQRHRIAIAWCRARYRCVHPATSHTTLTNISPQRRTVVRP